MENSGPATFLFSGGTAADLRAPPEPLSEGATGRAFGPWSACEIRALYRGESPHARTGIGPGSTGPGSTRRRPPIGTSHNDRRATRPARLAPTGHYIASTATTPGTAFMAPAICGESLKR